MKAASGSFNRIFPYRLSPGEDVFTSLQKLCEQEHILNGVMLSGIGSMNGMQVYDIQQPSDMVASCGYGEPIVMEGLYELLSMSGLICQGEDGKPSLHLHCTFADSNGHVFGGHMGEGCIVKVTVEGCIGELGGVSMKRELQPELGVMILNPESL
ncbi:MAG: DNA-binding protein [Oscillibacter sp.]|jgi:predicted DNA-binding protein with PD1-like motif|nr:DNA-binding protein [Oscillibacter sp.]